MILEVSGDILKSKAAAIAHGIAPHDNFAQGLALSLREAWPALYKDFRHYCHNENPSAGGAWFWKGAGGPAIINLLTQDGSKDAHSHPGKAKVEHLNHALKALRKLCEEHKISSVALPRVATGVGGLKWEEVLPLIKHHLGDLKIPIILYTNFQKGVVAAEKLS